MDRTTADYMGMLATVINACALQETLEKIGQPTRVLSAIEVAAVCEEFIRRKAIRHLELKRVTILAGGTGNPFFTTDSAAALRALEIQADALLKGTQVDGVYDQDPHSHPDAVRFDHLSYAEVIDRRLGVMDLTAIALCEEQGVPIEVFDISDPENLLAVLRGDRLGTRIAKEQQDA